MPYSNVNITNSQTASGFVAYPSLSLPVVPVPLPDGNGATTIRTATLPPWPQITRGPQGLEAPPLGGPLTFYTGVSAVITAQRPTVTAITFPPRVSSSVIDCATSAVLSFATPRATITAYCSVSSQISVAFTCSTTKIVTFLAPSAGVVTQDCSYIAALPSAPPKGLPPPFGFPPPPGGFPTPPSETTSSTTLLPIWATWPPGIIIPVPTPVNKPTPSGGGVVLPCKIWFFWVCSSSTRGTRAGNYIRILG